MVQIKVEEASRRYLDNLGYSQTNPPTKLLHNVLKASQKLSHEAPPKQGTCILHETDVITIYPTAVNIAGNPPEVSLMEVHVSRVKLVLMHIVRE